MERDMSQRMDQGTPHTGISRLWLGIKLGVLLLAAPALAEDNPTPHSPADDSNALQRQAEDSPMAPNASTASTRQTAYGFVFPSIEGGEIDMAHYRGKVVLVVNTASRCGFTPQYEGLQQLWDTYRYKGLVVIGVPSNDFANQEPEDNADIQKFCKVRFGVDFPLTAKVHVTGEEAHPFYQWAATKTGFMGRPHWNFHKYLIDSEGLLVGWYTGLTKPLDDSLVARIERLLASPGAYASQGG